jgi:WD40 repeat protein
LSYWDGEPGPLKPVTQLERALAGHDGPVSAVAVTPDGSRIVSGSDTAIRIWDLATGHLERTLRGHEFSVYSVEAVAITPDGTRIVSSSYNTVRVWDLAKGRERLILENHPDIVEAVAVTPDCARIVSGCRDGKVRVFDLASGDLLHTFEGHYSSVDALAVTPDSARIVSGSAGTVRVWASGRLECELNGSGYVKAVAVTPDGRRIVSGESGGGGMPLVPDHSILIWSLARGELDFSLEGHTEGVKALSVTRDGKRIVSGSADGSLRIWDIETKAEVASWTADSGVEVLSCCPVSTDASCFVYGDSNGNVNVVRLLEDQGPTKPATKPRRPKTPPPPPPKKGLFGRIKG